jgi:hypothetical protein
MTDGVTGVELLEERRTEIEASVLVATARMHSPMRLPLQPQLGQEDAGLKIRRQAQVQHRTLEAAKQAVLTILVRRIALPANLQAVAGCDRAAAV